MGGRSKFETGRDAEADWTNGRTTSCERGIRKEVWGVDWKRGRDGGWEGGGET